VVSALRDVIVAADVAARGSGTVSTAVVAAGGAAALVRVGRAHPTTAPTVVETLVDLAWHADVRAAIVAAGGASFLLANQAVPRVRPALTLMAPHVVAAATAAAPAGAEWPTMVQDAARAATIAVAIAGDPCRSLLRQAGAVATFAAALGSHAGDADLVRDVNAALAALLNVAPAVPPAPAAQAAGPSAAIVRLATKALVADNDGCVVCLEPLTTAEAIALQPCAHGMCWHCYLNVLQAGGGDAAPCPLCRAKHAAGAVERVAGVQPPAKRARADASS
jgi:hypothetical protein